MTTIDFEKKITIRLTFEDLKIIDKIIYEEDERFANRSHFIRCAVRKLIRETYKMKR